VSKVTVFRDRALVTRSSKEVIPAGVHTVLIPHLPDALVDQSLRVSGVSGKSAKITDVKIEEIYLDTMTETRKAELTKRMKSLQAEKSALERKSLLFKSQADAVEELRDTYTKSLNNPHATKIVTTDEWEKLLQFVERKKTDFADKIENLRIAIEEKQGTIDALEQEIRNAGGGSGKTEKQVSVTLNVAEGGQIDFEISYLISDVRWIPSYEARVTSTEKSLQVSYYGMVQQTSGENWKNIDLTLSTAQPAISGTIPTLDRWNVDEAQEVYSPRFRNLQMKKLSSQKSETEVSGGQAQAMENISTQGIQPMPVQQEQSAAKAEITSSNFVLPSKQSIPSDNQSHKVGISQETIPIEFSYDIVPKAVPAAFLTGKGKNTREYPLLAGEANVFLDNSFVATIPFKTIMPNDSFAVNLGVDEAIRVERKLVNRLTEQTGTFSSKIRITYEFEIIIENHKRYGVEVTLRDQIPVSRNEKIVIEQIEPSPKTLLPDADGILTWREKLPANEKRSFHLKFSIERPSAMNVTGIE
jgi:uncharacterized protein (TIGR02231 family)